MLRLFKKRCTLCKKQEENLTTYKDRINQTLHVCSVCKDYAERRAFQKIV
ncbi:hypothetical protein JMA_28570 [Jeotgalibacillus malaysiensis]|uniref:Uncharacterized protein n=1 Tax=Jeotgalibacillus malaysiensis TaxID=1508404 RepID=A0A0B5AVW2_9BACL|nr:hypothetical protein JMA_28570 [Jeotgalibacillus malaysiensis]